MARLEEKAILSNIKDGNDPDTDWANSTESENSSPTALFWRLLHEAVLQKCAAIFQQSKIQTQFGLCTRMAFHSSQLVLQACARASAWREGDGGFLLAPIPTAREMEVAYLGGTATVMLLDTQQAAVNPAWTVSTESQYRQR